MEMVKEVRQHLESVILPFWRGLKDERSGGFYGEVTFSGEVKPDSDKGVILHSRILWFFSNAYLTLKREEDLVCAEHAYCFLRNRCLDKKFGGVYWSVTKDGVPADTTKHTYNQAFAIYALSSFYAASGNKEALHLAYDLFDIVESRCRDEQGYLEAFDREFRPVSNEKLSENGVEAYRTMNTLLHVMEAYTELYRVGHGAQVALRIRECLDTIAEKVYNPEKRRQEVFFDKDFGTLIDLHSYGHDIEASWLIDRALNILGDDMLKGRIYPITNALAEEVYATAYTDRGVWNENERGVDDRRRVWWVQNESVIGFLNAYGKTGDPKFLEAASSVWDYCKEYQIDREHGEWYSEVFDGGEPNPAKELAGPWKCPYHNGRMCMEVIERCGG